MNNYNKDDQTENDIVVSNPSAFTATVNVERRNPGGAWMTICTADVPMQQSHVFALRNSPTCDVGGGGYFDFHVEDSQLLTAGAYRVTSNAPIVAYYYNSDDVGASAGSSGSSVLFPRATLGKKYYALTWPQPDPILVTYSSSDRDIDRSSMDIVASEDGTTVTITASTHILMGPGVAAMNPGDQQVVSLQEGDVLQLETATTGDDLSGTYVEADKPIAVFAGVECAVSPSPDTFNNLCDHVEEQMLPLIAWGRHYVAPRIAGYSDNCDPDDPAELHCTPSVWRILGSRDNTTVSLEAPPGTTLTPPGPFTLMKGQVQEIVARGSSLQALGDFFISADQPIFVMQLTGGEPNMVTSVPVEQYLPTYTFEVPDFFCSTLIVTRKAGTPVQLDNMTIADSLFVLAGGGYEVARLPLNQTGCGSEGGTMGTSVAHVVTTLPGPEGAATPAGISVNGEDVLCSYGYVGGLNLSVINPVE
jgi:hypothetical protein